jgi:hypothetical protein
MTPRNTRFCQAYLSEIHQIPPDDALKMLNKMAPKQKNKILHSYHQAKNEKQKIAKGEQLVENPSQLIAPKAQEPFAKPVPRPQKTDDEAVVTGSKLYSLMIPLEDIERLKQAAKDSGQSVSTLIRAAIKNHLVHYQ